MMPLRIKLTRPSLAYACTVPDYFRPTSRLYGRSLPIDCYLGTRSVTVVRAVDLTTTGADLVKIVFKLERRANLAGLSCFFLGAKAPKSGTAPRRGATTTFYRKTISYKYYGRNR